MKEWGGPIPESLRGLLGKAREWGEVEVLDAVMRVVVVLDVSVPLHVLGEVVGKRLQPDEHRSVVSVEGQG